MRTLVAGWFSFEQMGATAGDLLARDVACAWLDAAGQVYEVAHAAPFAGGIAWRSVDPARYRQVVFVCGPFGNGRPITEFLQRFAGCRLLGLNLSMLEPLELWNPFDVLLERDSSRTSRPDLAFVSEHPRVPVVGVALVHRQAEYTGAMHDLANDMIDRLTASREMSVVRLDTRLDVDNAAGLRSAAEVASLIARMDVVVTTRLHGLVLALKSGVPAIAVDPIAGGAKVRRQAQTIGWPAVFTADDLSDARLQESLDWCLTDASSARARECGERAVAMLRGTRAEFVAAIAGSSRGGDGP